MSLGVTPNGLAASAESEIRKACDGPRIVAVGRLSGKAGYIDRASRARDSSRFSEADR
jgi:hypothetical protein